MIFNRDSEVVVTRRVEEFIDQRGQRMIRVKKEVADGPIHLGSLTKPKNTDIIEIKCVIRPKHERNPLGNIFGGLFG